MNWIFLLVGGIAAFLIIRTLVQARPGITPGDAKAALQSGAAVLVDIREPAEWSSGVAQSAVLLPFSDLRGSRAQWRRFLEQNKGNRLLLYCHSGSRSGMAASLLCREGFDAVNAGSLQDWHRANWPVGAPPGRR
jgi:rhodanese-related sulfurtransferase